MHQCFIQVLIQSQLTAEVLQRQLIFTLIITEKKRGVLFTTEKEITPPPPADIKGLHSLSQREDTALPAKYKRAGFNPSRKVEKDEERIAFPCLFTATGQSSNFQSHVSISDHIWQ